MNFSSAAVAATAQCKAPLAAETGAREVGRGPGRGVLRGAVSVRIPLD